MYIEIICEHTSISRYKWWINTSQHSPSMWATVPSVVCVSSGSLHGQDAFSQVLSLAGWELARAEHLLSPECVTWGWLTCVAIFPFSVLTPSGSPAPPAAWGRTLKGSVCTNPTLRKGRAPHCGFHCPQTILSLRRYWISLCAQSCSHFSWHNQCTATCSGTLLSSHTADITQEVGIAPGWSLLRDWENLQQIFWNKGAGQF